MSGDQESRAKTVEVPKALNLTWLTLEALKQIGGSGSIPEIVARVLDLGNFTAKQQAVLHTGGPGTELYYQLAWARTYLKAAGALENTRGRGVWAITAYGRGAKEADMSALWSQARNVLIPRKNKPVVVYPDPICQYRVRHGDPKK